MIDEFHKQVETLHVLTVHIIAGLLGCAFSYQVIEEADMIPIMSALKLPYLFPLPLSLPSF